MDFEKFVAFLSDRFGYDTEKMKEIDSFSELGLDSLSLFNLLTDVEDEFNIQIDVEDLTEIDSISKMYNYIQNRLAEE